MTTRSMTEGSNLSVLRRMHVKASHLRREPVFVSAFSLMTNGGLTAILGFAFTMILTRLFPPSDVGLYSAIISATGLLALLSRFGFDIGMIRFLPSSKDPNGFIGTCQSVTLVGSIVLSVVFLAGAPLWSPALEFLTSNITVTALFIALTGFTAVLYIQYNYYIVNGRTRQLILRDAVRDVVKIGLVAAFVPLGLYGILGASLAGLALSFVLATTVLRRTVPDYRPRLTIERDVVKNLARYTTNNYLSGLVGTAPYLILPIIVVNVLGAEQGAYFFIAWTIATIIFLSISSIAISYFAVGARSPENTRQIALRSLKIAYLILLPTIACVFLFAGNVLRLFGEAYSENSTDLLIILSVCTIPMAFNEIYANTKRIHNEMKPLYLYNLAAAIGIMGLGILFMIAGGILGIGLAFLVTEVVIMAGILRVWRPWGTHGP